VVVLERNWDDIGVWKNELDRRPDALPLTVDVTNDKHLATAYQATIERFGTVDVICNNAGFRQRDVSPTAVIKVLEIPPEQWQRALALNATAPWNVIRTFIPPMLEKKAGSIVNTGSAAGDRGRPGDQPYGMSKAAFTNWIQSLAEELKPYNIACNIFSPGITVTTGFFEQRQARLAAAGERPNLPTRVSPFPTVPLRPETCVPLVLFFAQQDARVTGYYINSALEWNKLHGLGGDDVWKADIDPPANS
jgi:NAD(P)-dependent dehydrogenase (short-subunit alcohol dehydrogenase family)